MWRRNWPGIISIILGALSSLVLLAIFLGLRNPKLEEGALVLAMVAPIFYLPVLAIALIFGLIVLIRPKSSPANRYLAATGILIASIPMIAGLFY